MALSGDVKALIQANNGNVLAGTNNSARIYKSTDNGLTFTQIIALGSSSDSVNAFAKVSSSGYILAAVTGSSGAQGIWRSLDNGASWTRVKTHPDSLGYNDVTAIQAGSRLAAVGPPVTNNLNSPIVVSVDQGATWTYVSTSHYNYLHHSIAAYQQPVLSTQYPGEPYGGVFAFYGTDTYYTALGGVNNTATGGTDVGFSTLGGGAGKGALDMVSFLIKDAGGFFRRRALWAVKSSANVADTSIWQWPATPTGPYSYANISTTASENFTVMYVDPVIWQNIGSQRTIWAGADGKIFVSYNSGLSWAVATESPSGQIYSFVRTSSGVLIAGGASGEIFIFGGTGSEGGGDTGDGDEEPPTEPEDPDETGLATSRFLGRTATCDDEIFIANKFSFSNITHVFHYNGSTYTNLQFATTPPYSFLGTTASTNKAAYFGSKTNDNNVPGGTFSSVVFDITQIAEDLTIVWEYWNGSSWATLTTQDNTDQFKLFGVNSVSWQLPASWTANSVNSITAYWVRSRISAVGSDPVTPIHANRYLYTSLLPYIEIASTEIKGDIPALARIIWKNQSGIEVERSIYGLRSLDRGSNFNAFVNISDEQLPFGLTISKGIEAGVAWQDDKSAPTGRSLLVSYSDAGDLELWNDLASITLSTTVAREYHGYFKAMLRCSYDDSLEEAWSLRIQLRFGSGGTRTNTQSVFANISSDKEIIDFGQLAISTQQISSQAGSLSDEMKIVIQGYALDTSRDLILYDLILIPIDEWAIDARIPELEASGSPQIITHGYLDVDSITSSKNAISAYHRNSAGLIVSRYQNVSNGPVILQKNKSQRLWFLNLTYDDYWKGYTETIGSVQVYKQQQYLGFRGEN